METAAVARERTAAEWQHARRLYVFYAALFARYSLPLDPCQELASTVEPDDPASRQRVQQWLMKTQARIEIHQLRLFLQSSEMGSEETLRGLVIQQLKAPARTDAERDKVEFLLVQYLAQFGPPDLETRDVTFPEVQQALQPVIPTQAALHPPAALALLEEVVRALREITHMRDLLKSRILDRARQIKSSPAADYGDQTVLIAVTRFNYLLRRGFFQLLQAELYNVQDGLLKLEARGIKEVDCSAAIGLSARQPLHALRQICQDWKKPFREAYSAGASFHQIAEIRAAVEKALGGPSSAVRMVRILVDVEEAVETIAAQLRDLGLKAAKAVTVIVGAAKVVLPSWEAAAFEQRDDAAAALRRAAGARALLMSAAERRRSGGPREELKAAVAKVEQETAAIQARVAEAKQAADVDAAFNLAASYKRLLTALDEAKKLSM
jgi:hypothetical protein